MSDRPRKFLLYLRIVMPILFVLIGIYCLLYPEKIQLELQYSRLLGGLVIVYGLFRCYRAIKGLKEEDTY